ncbi:TlpA family protein disulfide reductase [Leeuwenhoekiella polynyae]|uniref:Thiol-disulfide isomerase/thioredoxin n=1 Tax=Leeuwenhoekiella polynyae TaxID=1550906 RepID=A0A4Q0NXZ3_9FLAO|nr:thioredoxin family protein [Leeuwenhoekiella polynyae]RXG17763.1 thiol-disulfide isomerase/thioredoxin [Leeuwenhoekiella polynyae]
MTRLLLFFFLLSFSISAQEKSEKLFFSEALSLNLNNYNTKVDDALERGEFSYAKSLFDSLVKNHLQGSFIDPLKFERLSSSIASTEELEKPTIILTYASWCIPNEGEIPVLNKMAQKYGDMVDFVVLFWDQKKTVRRLAKQFDTNIQIVYVDEVQNNYMQTVKLLKHALGISLSFVLAADGEILDINRRPPNKMNLSENQIFNQNITFLSRQIAAINIDLNININELPESLATF